MTKSIISKKILPLFAAILLLVIAFAFLAPTILTISGSFFTQAELSSNYGMIFEGAGSGGSYVSEKTNLKFIPDQVSFKQYFTVLFLSPEYLFKFWNSVKYTLPIVIFQTVVACLAAYGFTRYRSKGRQLILFMYIILMLMPYQVTLVPNRLVSEWLGIYGTSWAIILPGVFSPFAVFLLTKSMRRVPTAVIEAAKLDGCSELQIFFKIYMPLCKNIIYSVMILVFIDYWNMVEQPLILLGSQNEDMYPLSIFLSKINSGEVGIAFAVAVIYMIPTLLIFLYGEQYLVEGIANSGSVKG
ncbi:MAG: carbohydrate ABC transporter permease [Clostridiales bacterium]|nr:MAG: carbohydrate ABC transporter permease [Clostridiales bacterium]